CIAALPLLAAVVPTWQIPIAPSPPSRAASPSSSTVSVTIMPQSGADSKSGDADRQSAGEPDFSFPRFHFSLLPFNFFLPVWVSGAAVSGLLLIVGLARLRTIAARAVRIDSGRWA